MKFHSIQVLRGIAVLLVFLYHVSALEPLAIGMAGSTEAPLVGGLWQNGYAGVDLFFVISGFIMVFVTGRAAPSLTTSSAFLFARVARIYPLWWVFAGLSAAFFLLDNGAPVDVERLAAGGVAQGEHLIDSFLLLPQPVHPILGVGWTLTHEIYFYAVFALLLFAPRRILPALLAFWAAAVIIGARVGLSGPAGYDLTTLVFHPMTLEFILGAFTAVLVLNGRRWRPGLISSVGAFWFVAVLALQGDANEFHMEWGRVFWFAPPCVLLVYGLASLDIAGRLRGPAALVDLGDWSYAFYLSHMLTLKSMLALLPMAAAGLESADIDAPGLIAILRLGSPGVADNLFFFIASLLIAILVSWATFRFVEKPLLRVLGRARAAMFSTSNNQLRPRAIRAAIW